MSKSIRPLRVASGGICCAVGFTASAAIAAIRAGFDHFRKGGFLDDAGKPIIVSSLYEVPVTGRERLQYMFRAAMVDCLSGLPQSAKHMAYPIILLGAEAVRGEQFGRDIDSLLQTIRPDDGHHPRTCRVGQGKAGIGEALLAADAIFAQHDAPEYVIIVGADSLLDAATVERLNKARRILTSTNPDGFIPGEAAAAIALTPKASAQPSLWIEGLGQGHEPSSPEGDIPLAQAQGLTEALRQAIKSASAAITVTDYSFQASGVSGEQWYAREAALATDRAIAEELDSFHHCLVSQAVGEVGIACGPLVLAWVGSQMSPEDLGPKGLLHFSNDSGQRTALAVQYRR
jgi:3-oxoacyl-[acyl-carrier-protein] synthase-1